jgi:Type I phosphodiesterase / nucleotide pyrophosphatase
VSYHLGITRQPTWFVRLALCVALTGCGGASSVAPTTHVIEIDIDDHGLAGLWMANAPHLKGLIAQGTLAYTRVVVPTHSNQNNFALLTGQYPEASNVPANSWLSRANAFAPPVSLPGLETGDYARYDHNPLLTRGDSVYKAARRLRAPTAYFGELPPFEAGADIVHLSIVGASSSGLNITPDLARGLLTSVLLYPPSVVAAYAMDGPPDPGETLAHFTMRNAAAFIRTTSASNPMPSFMFVWDFIALDDDPTSATGANGAGLIKIVEDYDAGLGEMMAALDEKGLTPVTNILFTLDHGKVDTQQQVALGTRGGADPTKPADGQLAAVVAAKGPALGISTTDYALVNEDGDAQIYARVAGAGTAAGAARQLEVTHALLSLVQGGDIMGLDTTRTMTADGAMGTRRFHDFRASSPNQADIIVFPQDGWTLNQVDATNTAPGPFVEHAGFPYGRHGGFSVDELYVPLIMAGPAFKRGVLIPHPVEHPQVAATAMAALGQARLTTAQRPAISAALVGRDAEALPQPPSLPDARDAVLLASGFAGAPRLSGPPAPAVVLIDVAGLYDDEIFDDDALADAAAPLRQLAASGVRFQDFWTRSRDWPITEYETLVGGYPATDPWTPAAEDDPAQTVLPGAGLMLMPTPVRFVASQAGYDLWRQPLVLADESLFDAAHARGLTTALVGQPDFHGLHIAATSIDVSAPATTADAASTVSTLLAQHPQLLAVVALGAAREADRHSAAAKQSLSALAAAVAQIAAAAPGALVVLTSRGATTIDDPGADFYGAGSSRHVPFVIVGPNVRSGVVSSQPAIPADVPATLLFALAAPARTDFVDGTWAAGAPVGGIAQPTPRQATAGHALLRAFEIETTAAAPAPLP